MIVLRGARSSSSRSSRVVTTAGRSVAGLIRRMSLRMIFVDRLSLRWRVLVFLFLFFFLVALGEQGCGYSQEYRQ
jgi:hypothetical protein